MVLKVGHVEEDYYFFFISEDRSKPPESQQPETLVYFQILVFSFQKEKARERATATWIQEKITSNQIRITFYLWAYEGI